eukprot:1189874-Prorocentrum_minimum.AAC.8
MPTYEAFSFARTCLSTRRRLTVRTTSIENVPLLYPIRYWPLPPEEYAKSSVRLAYGRLYTFLLPDKHHPISSLNMESNLSINDQILLRVNKEPGVNVQVTPEGVHQDGAEITSVTLIERLNVAGAHAKKQRQITYN